MRFISLFAGVGGFDLALSRQNHTCVYANDIDPYCRQVYNFNFEQELDNRDIKLVRAYDIPDHELLVGGFPCQSFSVAGKRRGFDDTRGTLFFEIARILANKKPRLFLLENVKGLVSHDKQNTFRIILETLDELGYDLQWQVLNSKNFGVPQNRERIFIIGNLRGTPRPEVFPFAGDSREDATFNQASRPSKNSIASTLTVHYTKNQHGSQYVVENDQEKRYIIHNIYGGFGEKKPREFRKYAPTIRTPQRGGHIPNVVEGVNIRRLTPIECERLQGFPDNWTQFGHNIQGEVVRMSDTQRYKMMGNAVTVNVVEEIIRRLCV